MAGEINPCFLFDFYGPDIIFNAQSRNMEYFNDDDFYLGLIVIAFIVVWLIVLIFFLIAQQNTLKAIKPQNRRMSPGEVWLQLIPLFNLVWQFIVVSRISDSIRNEIDDRIANSFLGIADPVFANDRTRRPTYDIGLAYCILSLVGCIPFAQILAGFTSIAGLVCLIIYWTQIVAYKNKFLNNPVATNDYSPPSAP